MFIKLKSYLTRKISDSLIKDITLKHQNELKRLEAKYLADKTNIEKINEHRMKHLNKERENAIDKLNEENKKTLAVLTEKIRLMDAELGNEKEQIKKEREIFYKLEKFYKKKLFEFEFLTTNLKKWINEEFGELIRIQADNAKIIEEAKEESKQAICRRI